MATTKFPESQESYGSPSSDGSNRFATDALIRKHGYRIWERKKRSRPVWLDRNGIRYEEPDVLRRLPWQEVRDAEAAEINHFRRTAAA